MPPLAVTPITLIPGAVSFSHAEVLAGVTVRTFDGPLARVIEAAAQKMLHGAMHVLNPTHMIVVDTSMYLQELDKRLSKLGKVRTPHDAGDYVDISSVSRQVLMALTLTGRQFWEYGGTFAVVSERPGKYATAGYQHRPVIKVSGYFRALSPSDWFRPVSASALRKKTALLDPYYRVGAWWWDRLSVALGCLWSALVTSESHLSFAGMCMALEAICNPGKEEISHQLAERCALLSKSRLAHRINAYKEVKALYGLRSEIIHGRPILKKGVINANTLFIGAKRSSVPGKDSFRLLSVVLEVINGTLADESLMKILQTQQRESVSNDAINDHFRSALLR